MLNIEMKLNKEGMLVITIDPLKDFGFSNSGKTRIIASTQGDKPLLGNPGARLGLNAYSSVDPARIKELKKTDQLARENGEGIVMLNVEMKLNKEGMLVITIDPLKDFGFSNSGKSIIIASTQGDKPLLGNPGARLGLNAYSLCSPY